MAFAFEELKVYQRSLDFAVNVIEMIGEIDAPRKHYRLIEQIEASSTSVASNISEGKGRYSKKEFDTLCNRMRDMVINNRKVIAREIIARMEL